MKGNGARRWLYATVRWRGRLGLVSEVVGEWLHIEFFLDAKGNHYLKRPRRWLSKYSTVELVEPCVPLWSIWLERHWEGMRRAMEYKAQRRARGK